MRGGGQRRDGACFPVFGPRKRRFAMSDGPGKEALQQDVVRAWMPMAERLARQFRNRGETADDLQQVAMVGLVKAVQRYDPSHGTAFAVPTIVGEIKRHFGDHMWGLHVPAGSRNCANPFPCYFRAGPNAPCARACGCGGSRPAEAKTPTSLHREATGCRHQQVPRQGVMCPPCSRAV